MLPSFTTSHVRFIAYPAAAIAILTSCAQGVLFGAALGAATSPVHSWIFAAGSFAGAVMQPLSWLAAFTALRRWQIGRAVVALALGAACLSFAVLSSLGFVATSRTDAAAARAKSADTYALSKALAGASILELNLLAKAPRGNRKTEAAKAERRVVLERTIAQATEALEGEAATGAADPIASNLSAYASAVGLPWTADEISPWVTAAVVIFFELAAGASLIVASVFSSPAFPAPRPEDSIEKSPDKRAALIEKIREHGEINGSLQSIGKTLGLGSKSTVHRTLKDLEAAGAIKVHANGDGTRIVLS